MLGNTGSGHHQTCGNEIKNEKIKPQGNEKTTQNQNR